MWSLAFSQGFGGGRMKGHRDAAFRQVELDLGDEQLQHLDLLARAEYVANVVELGKRCDHVLLAHTLALDFDKLLADLRELFFGASDPFVQTCCKGRGTGCRLSDFSLSVFRIRNPPSAEWQVPLAHLDLRLSRSAAGKTRKRAAISRFSSCHQRAIFGESIFRPLFFPRGSSGDLAVNGAAARQFLDLTWRSNVSTSGRSAGPSPTWWKRTT